MPVWRPLVGTSYNSRYARHHNEVPRIYWIIVKTTRYFRNVVVIVDADHTLGSLRIYLPFQGSDCLARVTIWSVICYYGAITLPRL